MRATSANHGNERRFARFSSVILVISTQRSVIMNGRASTVAKQRPPYQLIAAHYRELISTGRMDVGSQLPTVRQLAEDWNVTRATVGKALAVLLAENLVETQGRGGTRVAPQSATPARQVSALIDAGRAAVITAHVTTAEPDVAQVLGVRHGEQVVMVTLAYPLPSVDLPGDDGLQE
jgi:DNA-binding GntR family transcriptional regulator